MQTSALRSAARQLPEPSRARASQSDLPTSSASRNAAAHALSQLAEWRLAIPRVRFPELQRDRSPRVPASYARAACVAESPLRLHQVRQVDALPLRELVFPGLARAVVSRT